MRPVDPVLAAWEAAEARLYPVAMTRPEVYARSLDLVRAIVAELADVATVEDLVAAFADAAAVAARALDRDGADAAGIDLGLATAAAFALRYRVLVAEATAARATRAIEEARRDGRAWATVSESGDPAAGPYARVEIHVADARGILASVELDADSGRPRYSAETVRLDPATGAVVGAGEPDVVRTAADAAAWAAAVEELRRAIARTAG